MSRLLVLAAIILPSLAAAPGAAEEPTLSVAAIIEHNVGARGEPALWHDVELIRLRGMRHRNGYEQVLTTYLQRSGRVRVELLLREKLEIFVYDGEKGWLKGWNDTLFAELDSDGTRNHLDEVQKYLRWPEFWHDFESIVHIDPLERDGGPADQLRVETRNGDIEHWVVDRRSGHVVEVTETKGAEGASYEQQTFAFDFRSIEGLTFPFYTEMDQGTSLYTIEVESIELDPPVELAIWTPPSQ